MYLNLASLIKAGNPENALRNVSWPVTELEKEHIFYCLEEATSYLLTSSSDWHAKLILRACIPILVSSIFNSVYTSLVVTRMGQRQSGITDFQPSSVDNYSWVIHETDQVYDIAKRYLHRHVNLKKSLKGLLHRKLGSNYDDVVLTINPTLERYLELEKLAPRFSRFTEWFKFSSFHSKQQYHLSDHSLCRHVFEAISDNIDVTYHTKRLMRSVEKYIAYTINFGEKQLINQIESIRVKKIQRLYTATQGYIGTRLLSLGVLENGGEVISFPHSGGMMLYLANNWFVEDLTSSKAFCYTPLDKELRESAHKPVGDDIYAQLLVLPQIKPIYQRTEFSRKIETVLYVAAGHPGDRFWPMVLPELIRLRLEVEILDALIGKGVQVTIKGHLKSQNNLIQDFLVNRYSGRVTFLYSPLQKVLKESNKYDTFVSENITAGSLVEVMKSRKPVILVTPFMREITSDLAQMLRKRVSVVECKTGTDGMPHLDVDALYDVLDRSTHQLDFEYVNRGANRLFEY